MREIRLRSTRAYEFFSRLLIQLKISKNRNELTFVPYKDTKNKRTVALDSVASNGMSKSPQKKKFKLDGSLVHFDYLACHVPTVEQNRKAHYATKILRIDRTEYTGRLLDVFRYKNKIYVLLGGILQRDRGVKNEINTRMFNLDDGFLRYAIIREKKIVDIRGHKIRLRNDRLVKYSTSRLP